MSHFVFFIARATSMLVFLKTMAAPSAPVGGHVGQPAPGVHGPVLGLPVAAKLAQKHLVSAPAGNNVGERSRARQA